MAPEDVLRAGCAVLAPALEPMGYRQGAIEAVAGSGAAAARVRWAHGDRWVETHVRGALGIVTYGWAEVELAHVAYLRSRGIRGDYPGYGGDGGSRGAVAAVAAGATAAAERRRRPTASRG